MFDSRQLKQINSLESALEVKLFDRSHRGLTLTKAGRSLYQAAKYVIQYCRDSVTRAKNAMQEDLNVIHIGSSPMTPAQLLMGLWSKIQALYPDIKFQIVPFENTPPKTQGRYWPISARTSTLSAEFSTILCCTCAAASALS